MLQCGGYEYTFEINGIEGDREDINATANRLLNRCRAVEVVVNTPRNPEQTKALNSVNSLIEGAVTKMQEDLKNSKEVNIRSYFLCSAYLFINCHILREMLLVMMWNYYAAAEIQRKAEKPELMHLRLMVLVFA